MRGGVSGARAAGRRRGAALADVGDHAEAEPVDGANHALRGAVVADREQGLDSLGIVLGGSGNGEQIAANKVVGVRAALAWNLDTARLARAHNDANVVAVGGRQHSLEEATELIEAFLAEPFSQDERHVRRIGKIAHYETTGEVLM